MVTFFKKSSSAREVLYIYYPEGDTNSKCGWIKFDTKTGKVSLAVLAEKDRERIITIEDMNALRDSADEMKREMGEPPLSEEEWPRATRDEHYYTYASHVIRRIEESWKQGELPEKGQVVWC